MLFGVCVNMLPQIASPVRREYIRPLAELGYDYVELPVGDLLAAGPEELGQTRRELTHTALPCLACNNYFTRDIRLVGPEPTPPGQMREYHSRALETACELGASYIVVGSPWAKARPEGWPEPEARRQLIQAFCQLGQAAAELGLIIAIEPNNRSETNMLNTYAQGLDIAREVGQPSVRMLQDYFHLRAEQDSPDTLREAGPGWLAHTHFSRYEGRRYPADWEEDELYRPYFQALAALGYQGGVSIEAVSPSQELWRREAAASLDLLRRHVG